MEKWEWNSGQNKQNTIQTFKKAVKTKEFGVTDNKYQRQLMQEKIKPITTEPEV